jgi:hypothetical protein
MRRYAGGTGRAAQGMFNRSGRLKLESIKGDVDGVRLQENNLVSLVQDGQSSLPNFSLVC